MNVEIFTRVDGQFKDVQIDANTITEFGVDVSPVYRRKGGFSKWFKRGYLISNGMKYPFSYSRVSELKKDLKDRAYILMIWTPCWSPRSAAGSDGTCLIRLSCTLYTVPLNSIC